jgi:HK97 family phage major capsid protein
MVGTRNTERWCLTMASAATLARKIEEFWTKADSEERPLTPDERFQVEQLVERLEQAKEVESQIKALDGNLSWNRGDEDNDAGKGPGDLFVESKGYKDLLTRGLGSSNWSTGEIELQTKGTVLSSPGTALTPAGYTEGVVQTLFAQPYLADLLPTQQAPGNPVRFVSETSVTNAAAATSEGGLKPESSIVFGETSEPVRKISTFLPVSTEMLEDAPQIQSYLNQRLTMFVKQVEEQQLLLGNGTAPNLQGFVASGRAIGTFTRNAGTTNELAIFKAANGTRGSSFLNPDTIIVHPSNWQPIRAGTDASGQYYGGGPFSYGPYGSQTSTSANYLMQPDNLWGMRVLVTSAITVGTALVGAFGSGAALFRKGGLRVEASDSHSTYFQTNLVAIRAELREALAVYRPSAFVAVVGLTT